MDTPGRRPRLSPEDRYTTDAVFRTLVDSLRTILHDAHYTPTELREAVILAAVMHENSIVRTIGRYLGDSAHHGSMYLLPQMVPCPHCGRTVGMGEFIYHGDPYKPMKCPECGVTSEIKEWLGRRVARIDNVDFGGGMRGGKTDV